MIDARVPFTIHCMRDKVLRYIREQDLMRPGDRVLVAVSGGADSVAMLRTLLDLRPELGAVLAVAHLNHGLRGEASEADEHFVAELPRQYRLEFFSARIDVAEYAAEHKLGVEAAGRRLRYDFLRRTAEAQGFNAVATAHTKDDQAETVLLKFLRGSGTRGRAGIHPVMVLSKHPGVRFVRPLLDTSRAETEAYLTAIDQPWREDESNLDHRFRRNRVRHELMPLLERGYNPNLREVLRETAEIDRAEEEYWNKTITAALRARHRKPGELNVAEFDQLELALQRRLLKRFLEDEGVTPDFQHIEQLRHTALGNSARAELPGGWFAQKKGGHLVLEPPATEKLELAGYEYTLPVPGEVPIPELDSILRAVPVATQFAAEAEPGTLLRADLLGGEVCVRNWRPGDRYRPACSGSEHKLKRLFSELHIPAEERPSWAVVVNGMDIVWVRGLRVADAYCWRAGEGDAVRIELLSTGGVAG